ncbi:carboxylesterase 4A-like isoform X2 [Leptidea sinapis]|uniref:carboxylesterase 4A-like isoform X1 n=1 Tax=Leptidea sinapis TaxID=189913 RepID=UPI0021C3BF01|nr:carboxylesterase 4A-like isoform X1 [Leptidea sinapis]XP_050674507.1 carboxylesterase 4A-like isoform X2 [Leptidea sinapis]
MDTEDCLYLTIFMPIVIGINIFMPITRPIQQYPVLIWFHEHSSFHGSDFFIDEEVIVVRAGYRTRIFGFLNTDDDFAEGNMGAKDIITAIKWVKNNIKLFNGDPERITAAGSGTAATTVASMLVSPMAKSLCSGFIVLSGSALSPSNYNKEHLKATNKVLNKLQSQYKTFNRRSLYEILSNCTTDKLLSVSRGLFDSTEVRDNQRLINSFSCSLEITSKDPFMRQPPLELYETKCVNNIPVIMGYTNLESLFRLKGIAHNRNLLSYLNYNFQYVLPFEGQTYEYESKSYKNIQRQIMGFYFLNGTITERSLRRYAKYISDIQTYSLLRQAVLQCGISSSPVYLYRFAFKGSFNIGWRNSVPNLNWTGATENDEICYLFRCKSLYSAYSDAQSNEKEFIGKIVELFANFVKNGNPSRDKGGYELDNLKWDPLKSDTNIRAMNLARELKMVTVPEGKRMRFWDRLRKEINVANNSK